MAEMTTYDDPRLDPSAYPLIVYVHVPKTGGSSVTEVLDRSTPRGRGDVHKIIDEKDECLALARASDWIGGHVTFDSIASNLIWLGRPVEYFATVREPIAQLISHLNYSFERYGRNDYYDIHSMSEHRVDFDVLSTNFSNPSSVINLLLRHEEFLDNQSRYVLGNDFDDITDEEMERRLKVYSFIASESELFTLYQAFGFMQIPDNASDIRMNVAKRHIDVSFFQDSKMREFLGHHHRNDLRLYAAVRRARWAADGRAPFRLALLKQHVTFDNFNEHAYLDSNPDVADAVRIGEFTTGFDHFKRHGHAENRMMRKCVFPPVPSGRQDATAAERLPFRVLKRLKGVRDSRAHEAAPWRTPR
jgi:hypothetical protein